MAHISACKRKLYFNLFLIATHNPVSDMHRAQTARLTPCILITVKHQVPVPREVQGSVTGVRRLSTHIKSTANLTLITLVPTHLLHTNPSFSSLIYFRSTLVRFPTIPPEYLIPSSRLSEFPVERWRVFGCSRRHLLSPCLSVVHLIL